MVNRIWLNIAGVLVILLLWQVVSISGFINPILLPGPVEVIKILFNPATSTTLLDEAFRTLLRAIGGFVIGAVIGIASGLVLGWSQRLYDLFEFAIDFFRSLPASALLPVFILFLGVGDISKVLIVAFACSLVLVVNTAYGVRNRNPTRTMVAQIEGATRLQLFQKVIFPEALPSIATGLRISISLALIIVVVTEMLLSTAPGLGRRILDAQALFKTPEMYAAIIITGALGYLLNKLISVIAEKVIHWGGK
jgi:ABC-type nitrate/sulfonate/bicarbonate transport system permease component